MARLEPMPHQWEAIEAIIDNEALLIRHGCIQGDAKIAINRNGKSWTTTLSNVVHMLNGGKSRTKTGSLQGPTWDLDMSTYVQREEDGVVRLAPLLSAWCSGKRITYTLTTESGREIRATATHPFLTERGWLRLRDIVPGDMVHVRGQQYRNGQGPKPHYVQTTNVEHHPYARVHQRPDRPRDQTRIATHRLVAEATLNGLPYEEYLFRIRGGATAGLTFLDPEVYEVHHRDRNSLNNHPDNLEVYESSDHVRVHALEGTMNNVLFKVISERVISVTCYGEEMTYDLEVADEPHNFLANGFVVHNTGMGKTGTAIMAIDILVGAGDVPILHIVPNSLIEQTVEEYDAWLDPGWTDKHLCVLDGKTKVSIRAEALSGYHRSTASVYLLSTECLSYKEIRQALLKRRWSAAFIDEGSRYRNYSNRTRTLQVLGARTKSRYVFSGNIMPRNPADVWYIMNFLVPRLFGTGNIQTFKTEYCILGGYTGMQPIGIRPDRIAKLRRIIDAHAIHAELSDVRNMPLRTLAVRRVDLKKGVQTSTYNQMRDELRAWILSLTETEFQTEASTYAVRLTRLLEIASGFARNVEGETRMFGSQKTDEMVELLLDDPDKPTIIWYWWTPELALIEAALAKEGIPFITFKKAGDGSRERFMNGSANVYISQLAKGAYGLNLTRATRMIYHSLCWDLDAYLQSQERNMRLTTTADRLEIEHMVVRGSVDEYVREKLVSKAGISRQLTRSDALKMLR